MRLLILSFLLLSLSPITGQVKYSEFQAAKTVEDKLQNAHELWEYYIRSHSDSLQFLAVDLVEFGSENKSESATIFAKRILGGYLIRKGDFKSGERELKVALNFHRKVQDKANETEDLNELGISNFLKGDYHSAESFFRLSLNSGKESPDETHAFMAELNLAKTYDKLGLKEKAKALAKKYLTEVEKLGKNESASNAYGFLSDLAIHEKNFPLAEEYLQKSLRKSTLANNPLFLAQVYANLGAFHAGNEDFDSSRFYFDKSLEIRTKINYKKGILEAIYNLGTLDFTKNDFKAAERQYLKGLEMAIKENFISDQVDFLEMLVEVYKETKNKEKELDYYQQFLDTKSKQAEVLLENKEENKELIDYFNESNKEINTAQEKKESHFWSGFLVGIISVFSILLIYHFSKSKINSIQRYEE